MCGNDNGPSYSKRGKWNGIRWQLAMLAKENGIRVENISKFIKFYLVRNIDAFTVMIIVLFPRRQIVNILTIAK
jgi:hypothetical protein